MQNLLTLHHENMVFPEHSFFRGYYDFDAEPEAQMQTIAQKAGEIGETNPLVIALQKHVIAVTAMLEGQSMIGNDDHRKYLDEPARILNESMRELFEIAQKML